MAMRGIIPIAVTAFVSIVLAAPAMGQGRSRAYLTDPGYISAPGETRTTGSRGSASSIFNQYSYGLGALSPYSSPTTDILRSNIGSLSSMSSRYSGAGQAGSSDLAPLIAAPTRMVARRPGPAVGMVEDVGRPAPSGLSLLTREGGLGPAPGYLLAIGSAPQEQFTEAAKPITSLVPTEEGMYRTYMERGEAAFKANDFYRAFGEFRLANDIGGHDWVSLLSMAHAQFAVSNYSFFSASHYLREALKYFPELPLIPLRPKEFYGDKNRYAEAIVNLDNHVTAHPRDGNAALLLAFFRWFDDNPQAAEKALARALRSATDSQSDELLQAVDTFWRAMARTGKVSGDLRPETQPAEEGPSDAPSALPASAAAKEPSEPGEAVVSPQRKEEAPLAP